MMNQVKNNVRSLFLSSAMLIGGAFGLSGCSEGDDPKPAGPTEVTGKIQSFSIELFGTNINGGAFVFIDEKTGEKRGLSVNRVDETAPHRNATITFDEVDPVTENSRIFSQFNNALVTSTNNKRVVATIRIIKDIESADLGDIKEFRLSADELSQLDIQPMYQHQVPILLKREVFAKEMRQSLNFFNDSDEYKPGKQPMPVHVWF